MIHIAQNRNNCNGSGRDLQCDMVLIYRGFILLENETFIVEPAFEPENGTHIVYRGQHLTFPSGTCGHGHNISTPDNNPAEGLLQPFNTRVRHCCCMVLSVYMYCRYFHSKLHTYSDLSKNTLGEMHVFYYTAQARNCWFSK